MKHEKENKDREDRIKKLAAADLSEFGAEMEKMLGMPLGSEERQESMKELSEVMTLRRENKNLEGIIEIKKEYYPCGKVSKVIPYEDGVKEGVEKWYYKDAEGLLMREATYINGKIEGEEKYYHKNGVLASNQSYKNDLQDGMWYNYDEKGKLTQESTYKNDKRHGAYRLYHSNGKLWEQGTYKNGERVGVLKRYNRKGVLTAIFAYSNI